MRIVFARDETKMRVVERQEFVCVSFVSSVVALCETSLQSHVLLLFLKSSSKQDFIIISLILSSFGFRTTFEHHST